jgi:hypothetical protein
MFSTKLLSKQTVFEVNAWLAGLGVFVLLATCVMINEATVAFCLVVIALSVAPVMLMFQFEPVDDKVRRPWSLTKQSWVFMFGGPVLALVIGFAVAGWSKSDDLPDYLAADWWPVAGFIAGQACGFFWRLFDNRRYHNLGLYQMLKSPSKWWIDYVQMPLAFALVLTWVFPMIIMWGPYAVQMLVLMFGVSVLIAKDGCTRLNPHDQHIRWNAREFRPL